jgi:hypothetical protein
MASNKTPRPIAPSLATLDPVALGRLRERFAGFEDTRVHGRVLHSLHEALVMAFCAMLSDNSCFTDMAIFCRSQAAWFACFLDLRAYPAKG